MQWSCQGVWWRTSLEGSVTHTGALSAKALAESVQSLRGWAEETEELGLERSQVLLNLWVSPLPLASTAHLETGGR